MKLIVFVIVVLLAPIVSSFANALLRDIGFQVSEAGILYGCFVSAFWHAYKPLEGFGK